MHLPNWYDTTLSTHKIYWNICLRHCYHINKFDLSQYLIFSKCFCSVVSPHSLFSEIFAVVRATKQKISVKKQRILKQANDFFIILTTNWTYLPDDFIWQKKWSGSLVSVVLFGQKSIKLHQYLQMNREQTIKRSSRFCPKCGRHCTIVSKKLFTLCAEQEK